MKLPAREDIDAPIADVFANLLDFDGFERAALRRGADVLRRDADGQPRWDISFTYRHRLRKISVTLARQDAPHVLDFGIRSPNIDAQFLIELVALGASRTRMNCTLEVKPRSLAARIFLQSLRLARSRVLKRYRLRIAQLAAMVEARLTQRPSGA